MDFREWHTFDDGYKIYALKNRNVMNNLKPKIFLSYAHVDLGWAKRIYDDLKRYGLDIWFDKESLLPGQDWEKENKRISLS